MAGAILPAGYEEQLREAAKGNPSLVNLIQAKLNSMQGISSGYLESLPKKVQNRIRYLQKLQNEHDELEDSFNKELQELEAKYEKLYAPLYDKRKDIVTGKEEAPAVAVEGEEAPAGEEAGAPAEEGKVPPGVPEFWLGVLRNNETISELITEKDEPVLEYLTDISSEKLEGEEKGFRLIFAFSDNPYFSNKTLVKTYYMVDDDEPILERVEGTKIEWTANKNPTVKVMKKKGKGGKGGGKTWTRLEPTESFFNFFQPMQVPSEGDEDLEPEEMDALQTALEEDYEMGEVILERLIPHAVSWFTGDAIDEEDGEEEGEDDDEDEDDDDEDDDEDDDDDDDDDDDHEDEPRRLKGAAPSSDKKGKRTAGKQAAGGAEGDKPAECKQQ